MVSAERELKLGQVAVGIASAILCLAPKYLPLADFPQHAAMLALARGVAAGDPSAAAHELNLRTPYLLAHGLAWPIAAVLGPVVALKLVMWLAITLNGLLQLRVLRAAGAAASVAFLCWASAFGFAFHLGLVNWLTTLPVAIAVTGLGLALARAPRPKPAHELALASLCALAFLAHGLMAAYVVAVIVGFALLRRGSPLPRLRLLLTLVPAVALFAGLAASAPLGARSNQPPVWELGLIRLRILPVRLFGGEAHDTVALWIGLSAIVIVALAAARPTRDPLRYVPLAAALGLYFLAPMQLRGVSFLWQRWTPFLLFGFALTLDPLPDSALRAVAARRAALLLTLGYLGMQAWRALRFDRAARRVDDVIAVTRPGCTLRGLIFDFDGEDQRWLAPYLHFGAYYQVSRGGRISFSFAENRTSFVRLKPDRPALVPFGGEWNPAGFNYAREGARYDYFLLHTSVDPRQAAFGRLEREIELVANSGSFWLYRRRASTCAR